MNISRFICCIFFFCFNFAAYGSNHSAFFLHSPAFKTQGTMPKLYTCDGNDVSPALHWSGIPADTKSLALTLTDIDAPRGTFFHWILYNIPPSTTRFPINMNHLPKGTMIIKNNWGRAQYNGPCPPKGATHYYIFTLYALDSRLDLPDSADGNDLLEAIQKHVVDKVELSATYGRR